MRRAWCALIFSALCAAQSWPQSCPLPPTLLPVRREKNIFTDQQESDLGDILADSLVRDESVIEDDALSAHLRAIASRVVPYLPENHLRLQFSLIELPDANAFSLPGGRVYVSTKLVASLRNDDELAGIIAHELGHIITHQAAISISQEFRQVLGVYAVTDRADIAEKLQRDRETWAAHKLRAHDSEDSDQQVADQVALYVMARAGFNLQAFADALDRTSDTRGKTGNWVTDLFHTTKPEQKRLRDAIREIGNMPAACIAPSRSFDASAAAFTDWQSQVIAYNRPEGHEHLTGVVRRQQLAQPLRPNIFNFHFSPDGKYILAQDEGGIHVLSREPLKDLFFINAGDALRAFFTPDSTSIVFYTSDLRIETWNIASQRRILVREMTLNVSCVQTMLAPDGKSLACYDTDGNLWLFDTATGNSIVERKNFFHPSALAFLNIMWAKARAESGGEDVEHETPFLFVNMRFSPDARYFLAGSSFLAGFESNTFAYDLTEHHEATVGRGVRTAVKGQFVFLQNRIIAVDQLSPSKSPMVEFPSGEKLGQLPLATEAYLRSSADGTYLIVGPSKDFALVLVNLKSPQSYVHVKLDAADEYNDTLVFEQADGSVGTLSISSRIVIGSLALGKARLSSTSAIAISPDFTSLAVSTRTRGAIWNLNSGQRVLQVRGFHSAWFSDSKSFFGDFPKSNFGDLPKSKDQERSLIKIDLASADPQASKIRDLSELHAQQFGHYLLITTDDSKAYHQSVSFDLRDFITDKSVWSHEFTKSYPAGNWDTDDLRVLLWWGASEAGAKEEMKKYPDLQHTAKSDDYFLEIFDMKKGNATNAFLVNTSKGSFRITDCAFVGDWVAVTTKDDRVITYMLPAGNEVGHVFGYSPMLSPSTNTLAVMLSETIMDIYDLTATSFRSRLKFSTPVIFRAFSQDEKQMFVMTSDQTFYVLNLLAGSDGKVASSSLASR